MQEDFGWKLVHGDVFRPPTHPMLLSVFLGAGAQFMCMIIITLSEYIDCHSLILPLSLSLSPPYHSLCFSWIPLSS